MAKSLLLTPAVQKRIDERVTRLLRELGNPEPPLRLEEVRELLKLNLGYFSGDNDGLFQQTISRLTITTKQVFKRPMILAEALAKFQLKALYLPDRKRIVIDDSIPQLKHRWLETHEIVHSLLPWHGPAMFGDNDHTPTPACHDKIEVESNYGSGQLVFFQQRFVEEARSRPMSIEAVRALKPIFGNTLTSTLWRFVEQAELPTLGVVSCHPHPAKRGDDFDPTKPCTHFVQSRSFATQFSSVSEREVFDRIAGYCGQQKGGPLGAEEVLLSDDNGQPHLFHFETFYNTHQALTLGRYLKRTGVSVAVLVR